MLLNYHIGRVVLGSMCVGVSVWLGWSCIRVAGFRLQHGLPPHFHGIITMPFRLLLSKHSARTSIHVENRTG